eukprot:50704_1
MKKALLIVVVILLSYVLAVTLLFDFKLKIHVQKALFPITTIDNTKTTQSKTSLHLCHSRDLLSDGGKRSSCIFQNLCLIQSTNNTKHMHPKHEVEWLYVVPNEEDLNKSYDTSFTLGVGPHSVDDRIYFDPIKITLSNFNKQYSNRQHIAGLSVLYHEYNGENFGHMLADVLMPIFAALDTFGLAQEEVNIFRLAIHDSIGFSCDWQIQHRFSRQTAKNCKRMNELLSQMTVGHQPVQVLNATMLRTTRCFETVVVGMSQYSGECVDGTNSGRIQNKWVLCNHGKQRMFYNFRNWALNNALGTANSDDVIKPIKQHQIVITNRAHGINNRQIMNQDDLVLKIRQRFEKDNVKVLEVEWHKMSLVEQLKLISATTVHVTPPGGVSFIALFLPRWATTIRLYPDEYRLEWNFFNYLSYIFIEHVDCTGNDRMCHVIDVIELIERSLKRYDAFQMDSAQK